MNFFAYSALLNAFIAGLLGFVIILKNRKELINRLFFGVSISVVFWSIGYWQWQISPDYIPALFWVRILSIGSLFIPIFYFHWILTFFNLNKQKRNLIRFIYFIGCFFLLFSFSRLFIAGVGPKSIFPFWPTPGFLYDIYLVFIYFILVFYSLIILRRQYKITPEPQKSSIKYIIIGSIIGFTAGATNFFLWYNIPILPYGNILVSIYPLVLAIAIFKYQLFNIRVIATELLTFTIWIFVLIRFFLSETIQERLINGGLLVFLIISGILLIRSVLKEVRQREKIEELAKELETANEKLKKLDQAKSDFVTITSHQLRSPVTAIKGYASMLSEGTFGEIPEKARMAVERIFQSSNRLVALIGDFLNLSRIERGKMEYDFKKVDLKEMIKGIMDEFKAINLTEKKNLDLSFNVSEKEDFMATIDSDKIRQVIYNLIDNAMKYTKTGFIKIFLYKEPGKGAIGLKVEDSGIGMSQGALGQIFEKFTRAEGSSALHTEGTGLGLYVAKEILKAHEGRIWAESEGQGKGSAFCVEFPYGK